MIGNIISYIYSRDLLEIFCWSMICIIGWGILGKISHKFVWKIMNEIMLIMVVAVILYVTLFSRNESMMDIILIPFHSFVEAKTQPEIYRSILMNIFLFLPLGLTFPFALPQMWKKKQLKTIIFACMLSVFIEFLQYLFQLGRCETDDVLCNILGTAIGTISYNFNFTKRLYRESLAK